MSRARALSLHNTLHTDTGTAVLDQVIRHAKNDPDRHAVVDGERSLSYRGLLGRVATARQALLSHGVRAGDVVAAVGPRSADTPVVFLALESLGASYLPIDPAWPEIRVRDVLDRSRVAVLLDYSGAGSGAARAAAESERITVVRLPAESEAGELPRRSVTDRAGEARYTIFTSGTTGRPKGATIEHRGLLNHLWSKVADLSLDSRDAVAFTAPLVFDISIWQMLCPFLVGGRVVVVNDAVTRMPRWLLGTLEDTGVTVAELVPTVIGWLVDETRHQGGDALGKLRWLLSTGEELYPAAAARILDAFPQVSLVNAYGPAECSDDVTLHVVTSADLARRRLPVGSPVANNSLYVLAQGEDGTWRAAEPGRPANCSSAVRGWGSAT